MNRPHPSKKLTVDFTGKLWEFYAGYVSPEFLDNILNHIEEEISNKYFPFSAESNLLRIFTSVYDKSSFLNYCIKYPHCIEILVSISANSNYLTDILVRDPEYFYWISNPSTLKYRVDEKTFKNTVMNLSKSYKTFNAKANALRISRRKEILRIGVKDIFGNTDILEITEELSTIAKSISAVLFELCYSEVLEKYNCPGPKNNYCIIALGKLGGNELNYSSDIDLIIFYDKNSSLRIGKEYFEILNESVKLFIETASSVTSSGYIYRVDLRLRPYGRNSPLTGSIEEYLNYYESRGEDWERQMLIKAGFVGGSNSLYEKFINYLNPFVYPASFSHSPAEQIKNLKKTIERNLNSDENIKLVPGGIRDIEFSVQALQLLNGGKLKNIITGNTLVAIRRLLEAKLLAEKEADALTDSYVFFRRIEHYLQLMNDTQTHSIPTDEDMLNKLSSYLGFNSISHFQKKVNSSRKEIVKIFNSITGISGKQVKSKEFLQEVPFEYRSKAFKDLEYLREGKGIFNQKEFDIKSIKAFQRIETQLTEYLTSASNPDLVLKNFVRIIRHAHFPSIWYNEFSDKKFFFSFLKICEYSQKSVDLFAEDEELREYFLSKKVFEKITYNNISDLNVKKVLFILSVQFVLGKIDGQKVSKFLSSFLKTKMQDIFLNNFNFDKSSYFAAALGSFGTGEVTFASDIDLIFIVDKIENYPDVQKNFQNLLTKLKDELKPFEIDCRLRPEGKSSLLVWDLKSWIKYFEDRARIWEFQAMCKTNFICGNKKLYNRMINRLLQKLKTMNKNIIRKDLIEMRKKLYPPQISGFKGNLNLKKSPGGLSDLDFSFQYILLTHPDLFRQFLGKSFLYFKEKSKMVPAIIQKIIKIRDNYLFIKNLEIANQVLFNSALTSLPPDEGKKKLLSSFLGYQFVKVFENELNKVINSNKSFYQNVVTGKN